MLLGTLDASLLGNILTGRGIYRAGKGIYRAGKGRGINRAGEGTIATRRIWGIVRAFSSKMDF